LAIVRLGVQLNGSGFVDTLALGYEDDDGEGDQIAAGVDLLARALKPDHRHVSRSA
jgi:hypothetical protein